MPPTYPYTLALHGGAGALPPSEVPPERAAEFRETLEAALLAGSAVLRDGGSSLDGVIATIVVLEDSPLFNAGKGSVLTSAGTCEMDASLMEGHQLQAGAIAGVMRIRNPIRLARIVLEKSPHVLLIGAGAEDLAVRHGVDLVDPAYFITDSRRDEWQRARAEEQRRRAAGVAEREAARLGDEGKFGTVGCVALDQQGNLAAGTSTGGRTNKRFGRVGDSPIIGAGTYANNQTCAVSCTGHGEFFIRAAAAHDISALMEYRGLSVQEAADLVVQQKLKTMGGAGGVVCLDRRGRTAFSFNTPGMFRAWLDDEGRPQTAIYER